MFRMVRPLGVKSRYKWSCIAFGTGNIGNCFGSSAFSSHAHCGIKAQLGTYSVGKSFFCSLAKHGG